MTTIATGIILVQHDKLWKGKLTVY